jgi:hypothetical protein
LPDCAPAEHGTYSTNARIGLGVPVCADIAPYVIAAGLKTLLTMLPGGERV